MSWLEPIRITIANRWTSLRMLRLLHCKSRDIPKVKMSKPRMKWNSKRVSYRMYASNTQSTHTTHTFCVALTLMHIYSFFVWLESGKTRNTEYDQLGYGNACCARNHSLSLSISLLICFCLRSALFHLNVLFLLLKYACVPEVFLNKSMHTEKE